MREFSNLESGVTIVDFGLSLTVAHGVATVHYGDSQADYFDALADGKLFDSLGFVALQSEQLKWLKDQMVWVERRIADDRP